VHHAFKASWFERFLFVSACRLQVDRATQDKQSAIVRAQGEAQSARLIGQAIQQNPSFITLRKIEAAREVANTIAHSANRVFLNADSLLLNLGELQISGANK
jgi:prohibitin 2